MKINIYAHYGSQNHGNEAIIRGLCEIYEGDELILFSDTPKKDRQFDLDKAITIYNSGFRNGRLKKILLLFTKGNLFSRIFVYPYLCKKLLNEPKGLYFMVAGDQYCEGKELLSFYSYLNKKLRKNGSKTVVYACSIKESVLASKRFCRDLYNHNLIIARESVTYNLLLNSGFNNVILSTCPAFTMKPLRCCLPLIFDEGKVIGITIGYIGQGKSNYNNSLLNSISSLVNYIISKTGYSIALIPHVNANDTLTDMPFLYDLYNMTNNTNRIVMMPEQRADITKYVISSCRMLVTVRTHASIAAYSSFVPSLVIGYSIKSFALARDIFGTDANYVYPIEEIEDRDKLITAFNWIDIRIDEIKETLHQIIPNYVNRVYDTRDRVLKLLED